MEFPDNEWLFTCQIYMAIFYDFENNDSYFSGHSLFCLKYFCPLTLTFSSWVDAEVLILSHIILVSAFCVWIGR